MENSTNQTPEKKKGKKKWIVIAVIVLLIAIVASTGSDEPAVTTNQNVDSSDVSEATDKADNVEKTVTDKIKAGTTLSNKQLKINYKSCDADFQDYSYYAEIKDGYKVVKAVFDFENISSTDVILEGFDCYADGVKCESFYFVDDYSNPILTSISAGRKLNDATVYYEVPADAESIELEYEANMWTGEKYIFIVE